MAVRVLGFVGVGRMGGPMASRLLDAGYRLCVYDLSDEATRPLVGARRRSSPPRRPRSPRRPTSC